MHVALQRRTLRTIRRDHAGVACGDRGGWPWWTCDCVANARCFASMPHSKVAPAASGAMMHTVANNLKGSVVAVAEAGSST
eukprot:7059183-Prymnesium_polylepis.1